MKRKFIPFLIVLILIFSVFAACAKQEGAATPTPTATPETSQPPEESPTPEGPVPITLPITDSLTTFNMWIPALAIKTGQAWGMQSPNDSLAYQELERRTNIHIEWTVPTEGAEAENFNLILVSDQLPDAFIGGQFGNQGYDSYIDEGYIIDLKDLIARYAPEYEALRTSADDIRRLSMTDEGRIAFFQSVRLVMEPSFMGLLARQDMLDEIGYEGVPHTYDEFYEMLVALKSKTNVAPLYLMSSAAGVSGLNDEFITGFGISRSFYQVDGKVKFGPIEPAFKDYLTMMNKWYTEGLIDPNFFSRKGFLGGDMAAMIKDDFGVVFHLYTFIDVMEAVSQNANYSLTPVSPPVLNEGDKRYLSYYGMPFDRLEGSTGTITTACEDPVSLVKWFGYFFTEEGALLCCFGVDEAYDIVDGQAMPSELITNNPDGLDSNAATAKYAMSAFQPRLTNYDSVAIAPVSDKAKTAGRIWDYNREDKYNITNSLSVSAEDSAEFSQLLNDIQTFVQEVVPLFIKGDKPLSEFEAFVEQVRNMGIDRCIEIKQVALDRFNAR
jgi:putative aldouronate transport system substrate-binding protein